MFNFLLVIVFLYLLFINEQIKIFLFFFLSSFTFCQYPFVLSVNAKRTILKRDSEQQMIVSARVSFSRITKKLIFNLSFFVLQRSMIQKFQNKQAPNLNMLFLNLYIRRSHLVNDSLAEVNV